MTVDFEKEIINKVQQGDTEAFGVLVEKYQKQVYNLALKLTGSRENAEDLAQEVFLKAFRSIGNFRGESKFSVWLYRITSNVCMDFLRSEKRKNTVSLTMDEEDDSEEIEVPDLSSMPEEELEKKITRQTVAEGLNRLPENQRQILVLREVSGLSYDEISDILSIEPGTVKSRISRARKKLCEYLINTGNIPEEYTSKPTKKGGVEE